MSLHTFTPPPIVAAIDLVREAPAPMYPANIVDAIQKMPLEERLEGLAPEQVLSAFAPEPPATRDQG